jgi:hypothetical protein
LEEKLRAKYGNEINLVESKKHQMSELYMAAIKNPGSNEEQEKRLQQVLRGGKGDQKRHHAIDTKYYGTEEGLEMQKKNAEEMHEHQEEERKKMKKIKKRLKKLRKLREEQGEGEGDASSEEEEELEEELKKYKKRKKAAAAAGAAYAAAVGSAKPDPDRVNLDEPPLLVRKKAKSKDKKKKNEEKVSSGIDLHQVATLTAVAGAAALIGFLVGGGSRRQ